MIAMKTAEQAIRWIPIQLLAAGVGGIDIYFHRCACAVVVATLTGLVKMITYPATTVMWSATNLARISNEAYILSLDLDELQVVAPLVLPSTADERLRA